MPKLPSRPEHPLTDEQVAALIEQVARAGGFLATQNCSSCGHKTLIALPSEKMKKASPYARTPKLEHAYVCMTCDEAYKVPKLSVAEI